MNLQEYHIPAIKAYLSKKYYFGDKWVGYENDTAELTTKDLFCFRDLNREPLYHRYPNGSFFKCQPIPTVLKSLDPETQDHQVSINEKLLVAQIQLHSIRSFHTGMDLQANLAKGDLFPVMYQKVIVPERDIDHYQLIQHTDGILVFREPDVVSMVQTYSTYKEAEEGLRTHISQCADYDEWERPDFRIIGVLKGQEPDLDSKGNPVLNSALLITNAIPVVQSPYNIIHVQKPESPVIDHPMLAKFNVRSAELEFYNGSLQREEPGTTKEYLPLTLFSMEPVVISLHQSQQLNKEQQKEHQKVDHTESVKHKRTIQ